MERAMKVQNVMLQAMAKEITWWQSAEILGISDRHMRRWRERYVGDRGGVAAILRADGPRRDQAAPQCLPPCLLIL
jgi:hypothetical protein